MLKNKLKAFTLIELLGVVILLAIISLIATPIVLNVIKEAQASADMSSANLIVSNGHNYYAASLLDESKKEKIDNYQDIYDELDIQNKPEFGQLYVNSNDKVAMAVIINNKCYKKDYMSEIEVVDVSECDLGYMGPDEVKPTISQSSSNTNVNENGWYKEDIYLTINVEDNESGVFGYKRCMGQSECEPDDTIYTNESILINTESASNYVCVIGVDNRGNESDKNCEVYKLDKTLPTIEGVGDIKVNRNEVVNLTSGVTYNDGLSGIDGELSINPTTVDTSTIGTKPVTYKVQDIAGNVREVVRNVIVDADAPTIVFSLVDSSAINSNGWAKSDFYIRATITDNSGTGIASGSSCTTNSSSECTPSASFTGTTKDFLISVEGSNRACVQVTDNNNKTTKVCSNTYNLDKTAPTAGTATFSGTLGSNSWYTTNVTVNRVNGSDSLSGHSSTTSNVSSITSNTTGTTVTITTTDLVGNTATRNYTIKVDKNAPTLTAKSSSVTITQGSSNAVSNYFTVSYGISGGNIVCTNGSTTITNLNSLTAGNYTITCTATGGNGKSSSVNISVKVKSVGYLYYVSVQSPTSYSWNLYRCDPDGSNCTVITALTGNRSVDDYAAAPTVSIGENYMYYTSAISETSYNWDLYRCDLDGSNCTVITTLTGNRSIDDYAAAPTVSVGENYMYYTSAISETSYNWDLYRCNLDGSNCTVVTTLMGNLSIDDYAASPKVSVSENYMYYISALSATSESWNLYRCNAAGSNCTVITTLTGNWAMDDYAASPTVSVSENYMYYTSAQGRTSYFWSLYRCNANGSNCSSIATLTGNVREGLFRGYAAAPTVSVGEEYMYYISSESSTSSLWDLYRCNTNGSSCSLIATLEGNYSSNDYAASPNISIK